MRTDSRSVARSTLIVIGLVVVTALALLLVYETRRVLVWMVIAAFFATALYRQSTGCSGGCRGASDGSRRCWCSSWC
jgi:cobalamin synthase